MSNQRPPYILIGDDDADDKEFLAESFLSIHPEVELRFFNDGSEVIGFLEKTETEELPMLILLDYKMPIVSAPEVLMAIQKDPRYHTIPKIVWSTSDNPEFTERCFKYGANRYFAKPSSPAQMDRIVAYLRQVYESRLSGAPDARSGE